MELARRQGVRSIPQTHLIRQVLYSFANDSCTTLRGDDDYFSSDLDDAAVEARFGKVDRPILLLPGERDELVLPSVDKKELLERWVQACPEGGVSPLSRLVPKADHAISEPEAQAWVGSTVRIFLESL